MSSITFQDIFQAIAGSVSSILFFFAIRGSPLNINPTVGVGVGVAWLWLLWHGFRRENGSLKEHFIMCFLVTAVVSTILALIFNMITANAIFTFDYFGGIAWMGILIGLPAALLFDLHNIDNVLSTHHIRKR
jgi:hypothetical protein